MRAIPTALICLALGAPAGAQTNGAPAAGTNVAEEIEPLYYVTPEPKPGRLPRFVDPLSTNLPWATFAPSGMMPSEILARRAASAGVVGALPVSRHSSIGMRRGDLEHLERVIDHQAFPEWSMLRWEALADRYVYKTHTNLPPGATNSP